MLGALHLSWSHWLTEHVSALVRAPSIPQAPILKVLPGSTISYHSDNRQSEHSFMSAEISHKTKSRRSQTACALGCLAPAGPPWIPRCIVRVFHATCCFLPLNKIVGLRLRNRVRCCETASCQRQDNAESHGADRRCNMGFGVDSLKTVRRDSNGGTYSALRCAIIDLLEGNVRL